MASYGIHLAIAKKYLGSHPEENVEDFIQGTLDVDLAEDRIASHYQSVTDNSNLIAFLNGKVGISSYAKEHSINSSYDRGYFLHLLTDYYFYTEFFDKEWLSSISYGEFKKVVYHDYGSINRHLLQEYNIEYPEIIRNYNINEEDASIIISENDIDKFINRLSSIDLDSIHANLISNSKVK